MVWSSGSPFRSWGGSAEADWLLPLCLFVSSAGGSWSSTPASIEEWCLVARCKLGIYLFFVEFMGCYEYTNPNDEPFWHHDLQCQDSHHLCWGRQKQLEESELLLFVNSILLNGYGSLGCQFVPGSLQSIILHMSHMIRTYCRPVTKVAQSKSSLIAKLYYSLPMLMLAIIFIFELAALLSYSSCCNSYKAWAAATSCI
jgi:hypothetical protein